MKNTILFYTDAINMMVYKSLEPNDFKELFMGLLEYNNGIEKTESSFSSKEVYDLFVGYKNKIDINEKKYENRKERNKRYYESHKTTITPNKEFEKPSIEDEYKVDIPNIQLEDEDIPTIEPEPTLEPEPVPAPEPVFKLSSEPSDNKKRYYNFDTPKSSRINQYIESNKGGIKLLGVQKELIPMIQQEGYTEDEAINIYKNIAIEVDKDYRAECPF